MRHLKAKSPAAATFLAEFRKSLILLGQIVRNKANMVDGYEKGD